MDTHSVVSRRRFLQGVLALSVSSVLLDELKLVEPEIAQAIVVNRGAWSLRYPLGTAGLSGANYAIHGHVQITRDPLRFPVVPVGPVGTQLASPVYYGALAKNITDAGNADNTGTTDGEEWNPMVLRQVSAHNHRFGDINLHDSLQYHLISAPQGTTVITSFSQQQYYLYNEPETWYKDRPFSRDSATVPSATNLGVTNLEEYNTTDPALYRIRPAALAKLFLIYKPTVEGAGHRWLMASSTAGTLGALDPTSVTSTVSPTTSPDPYASPDDIDVGKYWRQFFDWIHKTGWPSDGLPPIDDKALRAIHLHAYHPRPTIRRTFFGTQYNGEDPIWLTAYVAQRLRLGSDWYRTTYNSGADLELDYIISETGPRHQDVNATIYAYAGYFLNLMVGLCYWNTWLHWLARRAKDELNLAPDYGVFAMIQLADYRPFVIRSGNYSSSLNAPTKAPGGYPSDAPATAGAVTGRQSYFKITASPEKVTTEDFPLFRPTGYNGVWGFLSQWDLYGADPTIYDDCWTLPWKDYDGSQQTGWGAGTLGATQQCFLWLTPMGATSAVWGKVGGAIGGVLGTGWYNDGGTDGLKGTVSVALTEGWNTVYIPLIKDESNGIDGDGRTAANSDFKYSFSWYINGHEYPHGEMLMDSNMFPNGKQYPPYDLNTTQDGQPLKVKTWYHQAVPSAMLCPLLVNVTPGYAGTYQLRIRRQRYSTVGATVPQIKVLVGPPTPLNLVCCTWNRNQ